MQRLFDYHVARLWVYSGPKCLDRQVQCVSTTMPVQSFSFGHLCPGREQIFLFDSIASCSSKDSICAEAGSSHLDPTVCGRFVLVSGGRFSASGSFSRLSHPKAALAFLSGHPMVCWGMHSGALRVLAEDPGLGSLGPCCSPASPCCPAAGSLNAEARPCPPRALEGPQRQPVPVCEQRGSMGLPGSPQLQSPLGV